MASRGAHGKHPHVRGEDPPMSTTGAWFWETPPRAWGRQRVDVELDFIDRNTPTCVGKTRLARQVLCK